MTSKLFRKIFLATSLVLLLSVVVCFLVIYFITLFSTKDTIEKIAYKYNESIENAQSVQMLDPIVEEGGELLFIGVMSSEGKVLSVNYSDIEIGSYVRDEQFVNDVKDGKISYRLEKAYSEGETMLIVYYYIENPALDPKGYVVSAFGLDLNFNDNYFWMAITGCIASWIVIASISYTIFHSYIKNEVIVFEKILHMLETINKGNYNLVKFKTDYGDINEIIENINIAGQKISSSINDLKYEQSKSGFILDNIAQGIMAVSEKNKIILSNDVIVDIFNTKENIAGVEPDYFIKDEKIIEEINKSIQKGEDTCVGELAIDGKVFRIDCKIVDEQIFELYNDIKYFLLFTDVTSEANITKVRGEFFANASHELKTPLTAIMGYAELLQNPNLSEKNREKCSKEIFENSQSMLTLINEMLTLSKLDSEKLVSKKENLSLAEQCDTVIKKLFVLAKEKNIDIECEGDAQIVADKTQMYTIISNVVGNAIKYNNIGGWIKINISEEENKVMLTVEDNGIGISKENQTRIFERFFRVDNARTRTANQSTGLGLAIVKKLVEENNGEIKVESSLGVGTKIIIIFKR